MRAKEVLGVIESDNTALQGSYESALKINKIGGVCVQGENPTPTNPQEIKKSVVSVVKTHGKNFWKYGDISDATQSGISWTIPKGTYIFSCSTQTFDLTLRTYFVDGTSKVVSFTKNATVFTLENDVVSVNYNNPSGNAIVGIQIEEGTFATEYEPYTGSSITLSQPIELYKIGDVQDTIEGGKVNKKFAKVVFNGTESWGSSTSFVGRYYTNNLGCGDSAYALCSQALRAPTNNTEIINTCYLRKDTGGRFVINTEFATVSEWKAHLQANPMTVVYRLAEPIVEDLPLTDQIALSCLKTFHGITYVESDGEVQPTFNSEYATNLEGAITLQAHADNKIGKANTLVNRAEGESNIFEVRVEHGLMYLYKDDVLHGVVGANNVVTNDTTYKTMNVRAEEDADFIALTNKKTNAVCYYMNINKVPFTSNNYTEAHYFAGDARFTGNIHANDYIFSNNLQVNENVIAHTVQAVEYMKSKYMRIDEKLTTQGLQVTSIGIGEGATQPVEWVWDGALQRWVLCTVTGQQE